MTEKQYTLFDEEHRLSKTTDPFTSHAAAKVAVKSTAKHKEHVREIFRRVAPAGLIDEELESFSKLKAGAASKRRSDLSNDGDLGRYVMSSIEINSDVTTSWITESGFRKTEVINISVSQSERDGCVEVYISETNIPTYRAFENISKAIRKAKKALDAARKLEY